MDDTVPAGVESLLGTSAGKIWSTALAESDTRAQALSEAAEVMWESLCSAWVLLELWNNGATVWRSRDGDEAAFAAPDGYPGGRASCRCQAECLRTVETNRSRPKPVRRCRILGHQLAPKGVTVIETRSQQTWPRVVS